MGKQKSMFPISPHAGIRISTSFYNDHGRCYTFKPPLDVDGPVPGEQHGYKFFFDYRPGDREDHNMYPDGHIDIFVHDPQQMWTGENENERKKLFLSVIPCRLNYTVRRIVVITKSTYVIVNIFNIWKCRLLTFAISN